MIRYPYFRFFNVQDKNMKTEKHHVLYIPSFRFLFSDSIWKMGMG